MARTRGYALAAYHEAGHAVVGLSLKLPVIAATIDRRYRGVPLTFYGECAGWCDAVVYDRVHPGILNQRRRAHLETHIVNLWTGYYAERIAVERLWDGVRPSSFTPFGQLSDYRLGRRIAWACGVRRSRRRAFVLRFESYARRLTEDLWPAIDWVALKLMEKRTLLRPEIQYAALDAGFYLSGLQQEAA